VKLFARYSHELVISVFVITEFYCLSVTLFISVPGIAFFDAVLGVVHHITE
jgi:hypothetical protein